MRSNKSQQEGKEPLQARTEVPQSSRVKQLKKTIQDELGIQGKPVIKLFLIGSESDLADDKLSLKDSGILDANGNGNIEVEVYIKISVEVQGKGKDYSATVEVQPSEEIDVLKSKIHFFKQFVNQRKLQLVEKATDKVISDYQKTFKDFELKDGA
jgi:hypothetical protein